MLHQFLNKFVEKNIPSHNSIPLSLSLALSSLHPNWHQLFRVASSGLRMFPISLLVLSTTRYSSFPKTRLLDFFPLPYFARRMIFSSFFVFFCNMISVYLSNWVRVTRRSVIGFFSLCTGLRTRKKFLFLPCV